MLERLLYHAKIKGCQSSPWSLWKLSHVCLRLQICPQGEKFSPYSALKISPSPRRVVPPGLLFQHPIFCAAIGRHSRFESVCRGFFGLGNHKDDHCMHIWSDALNALWLRVSLYPSLAFGHHLCKYTQKESLFWRVPCMRLWSCTHLTICFVFFERGISR